MKKYISIGMALCMGVLVALGAFGVLVRAEKNRVVFYNREASGAGLYITKHVILSSGTEKPSPEDCFSFFLKLEGLPARELDYRLFHKSGKEIFNYNGTLTTEYDKTQLPIPFSTDQNGRFSLKDGETAFFEGLRPGNSYEITEEPCVEYQQTEPAGNRSAGGILLPEGNAEVFRNRYCPHSREETEEVTLEISKQLAFPKGFTPPESPEFTFQVTINGKPWAKEPYTIYHGTTDQKKAAGFTDEKGQFLMRGGQRACFLAMPGDADYQVVELEKKGWTALTASSLKGGLQKPVTTLSFTNTQAAFGVKKEMADGILTDQVFQFQLTKDSLPWAGAQYYLYSVNGSLMDHRVHTTDEKGQFLLMADQAAIFLGLPMGTGYSVSELPNREFRQAFPPDPQGYPDRRVSDTLEVLPFRNQVNLNAVQPVSLSLLKKNKEETPLEGAAFRISRDEEQKDVVARAASGKDGLVNFGRMEPGTYYINEVTAPVGYSLLPKLIKIEVEKEGIRVDHRLYQYGETYPEISFSDTQDGRKVCITIYNDKSFKLPLTGGRGPGLWILSGIIGICLLGFLVKVRLDKMGEIS